MSKLLIMLLVLFGSQNSFAKIRLHSSPYQILLQANSNGEPPSSTSPVYVSGYEMQIETSDSCDTVINTWKQLIGLDEIQKLGGDNVGFMLELQCERYAASGITDFNPYGYFYATSAKGAEYLASFAAKYYSTYGYNYGVDRVISSAGTLTIHHFENSSEVNPPGISGLLPIRWSEAAPRLDNWLQNLKQADGPKRKEIELSLAQQLWPDKSAQELSQDLSNGIEHVDAVSVEYTPIFVTSDVGAYVFDHVGWSWDYQCPAKGQCYQ